ncbi:hypothetical protein I79_007026 [Cricetulus griseus]|uniref:Uncharacterized protein n=1 Tax=Cricetulus griseus TaxID=10029 RepID=G3H9F8_CRIGR|nr:hypothetical protein I79_007026 [Cricetulus griseus]
MESPYPSSFSLTTSLILQMTAIQNIFFFDKSGHEEKGRKAEGGLSGRRSIYHSEFCC